MYVAIPLMLPKSIYLQKSMMHSKGSFCQAPASFKDNFSLSRYADWYRTTPESKSPPQTWAIWIQIQYLIFEWLHATKQNSTKWIYICDRYQVGRQACFLKFNGISWEPKTNDWVQAEVKCWQWCFILWAPHATRLSNKTMLWILQNKNRIYCSVVLTAITQQLNITNSRESNSRIAFT